MSIKGRVYKTNLKGGLYLLFDTGKQFPDSGSIKRLSKYKRGQSFFDGNHIELYERASELLKDTPHRDKLKSLYIAANIIDPLTTKPADLMFGEPPIFESGKDDDSPEQKALNRLVEENDLVALGQELVVGSGIRGDGWIKTIFNYREDYSEYLKQFGKYPDGVSPEVLIELVPAQYVFPETSDHSVKKFKAVNIAFITWESNDFVRIDPLTQNNSYNSGIYDYDEIPYLNVERHIPGMIEYYKFRLHPNGVNNDYLGEIETFIIGERVPTGLENDVVETGLPFISVFHCPYRSLDDRWEGVSNIEKVESLLSAIMDRLVQIDYILWKHADPNIYGPAAGVDQIKIGGRYIPVDKDDVIPGYMEWNSQLEAAFKELDRLVGMVFAICETPQWIFGSAFTQIEAAGTGTSHTDGAAIRARFMPILSKVNRIRIHVDKTLRDVLWAAQLLEQYVRNQNPELEIEEYEPTYPKIIWKDGLPENEKELAEIMQIRLASGTIDTLSAIKRLEGMDDEKARAILEAIKEEKVEKIKEMNEAMSMELSWDRWDQENNQSEENDAEENEGNPNLKAAAKALSNEEVSSNG